MYNQEKIKPYRPEGEKAAQVEEMFDHIAPTYDTLNHRLSWNIDRWWRRTALRALAPSKPRTVLDIATGTGDFALMAARMLRPARLVGTDISEGMMRVGRAKVAAAGLESVITMQREDAERLSFADNTFDAVTAAFGIRNFQHLDRGLAEMCRVLREGGTLCVIELTTPVGTPMRQLFRLYSRTLLPAYGRLISKDARAYEYLAQTIAAFPQGEQMQDILRRAGFGQATFRRLTFGICTLYLATK